MEVDRVPTRLLQGLDLVAAVIASVADVKRLMKVASKMCDPEQCLEADNAGLVAIREDGKLAIEPGDDKKGVGVIWQQEGPADRDVDVVSTGGRGEPVVIFRSHTVRPRRTVFERPDRTRRRRQGRCLGDQFGNLVTRSRGQLGPGDIGDSTMTSITPCRRRRPQREGDSEAENVPHLTTGL